MDRWHESISAFSFFQFFFFSINVCINLFWKFYLKIWLISKLWSKYLILSIFFLLEWYKNIWDLLLEKINFFGIWQNLRFFLIFNIVGSIFYLFVSLSSSFNVCSVISSVSYMTREKTPFEHCWEYLRPVWIEEGRRRSRVELSWLKIG